MKYTFEKITGVQRWQVRLKGEFVTYVTKKDPKAVDELLKEHGWETRESYFDYCVESHMKKLFPK